MKRIIALVLVLMLLLTGCGTPVEDFILGLPEQIFGNNEPEELPDETPNETPDEIPDETPDETPDENPTEEPDGEHKHTYSAEVTYPGCETEGYTTYTCSCGDSYTDERVEPTGHDWLNGTGGAPTVCMNCGIKDETPRAQALTIHYIDVGQGDGILIKIGDCDVIIDAGTANYGTTVSNYLKGLEVDDVDLMINTHPDADHCGGLTQVLKDYVVEEVWASPLTKTTAAYTNFASAVTNEGLTMVNPAVGTVFSYAEMTLTVLYGGAGTTNANDSSIVVMVEYGEHRFLFTGDISNKIETKLLNENADLECDVLKVGHHGSRTSSSAGFLAATGAEYAVICVGTGNSYGHPTSDALSRLKQAGMAVYRTDLDGHVVFSTDGVDITLPDVNLNGRSIDLTTASRLGSYDYAYIVKRITYAPVDNSKKNAA